MQGRITELSHGGKAGRSVLYWMSREQRVESNFGLFLAQSLAKNSSKKLFVVFALADEFLGATLRQYSFMFDGLVGVEGKLAELNIPFALLFGNPPNEVVAFAKRIDADTVVCDFDPLKIKKSWQKRLADIFNGSVYEVDGHNIVPCRTASAKQEFGARTLRPKIKKVLFDYLAQEAKVSYHAENEAEDFVTNDFLTVLQKLKCDRGVKSCSWVKSGEAAAKTMVEEFVAEKLDGYSANRNDPNKDGCSNMSIYLHFGQIYAGDIAKAVISSEAPAADKDAYLEELIVRRELADNYCFYNENYDNFDGFPNWAKQSLSLHEADFREQRYSVEEFEEAKTHDLLWNAAQKELLKTGKIHGYMRMYWAKKILEWSDSVQVAQKTAIYLNDKYALDGRDPNGYTGIAWSIGGVHDRAWFNRPVFGKVRYMNANGAKSKFDIEAYVQKRFGVKVVRRSITKYRQELNIAASAERKRLYEIET